MTKSRSEVRVSIPGSAKIVDARDPYAPIPRPEEPARLYGSLQEPQPGDLVCVTLDGGRLALVMRSHLTMEAT